MNYQRLIENEIDPVINLASFIITVNKHRFHNRQHILNIWNCQIIDKSSISELLTNLDGALVMSGYYSNTIPDLFPRQRCKNCANCDVTDVLEEKGFCNEHEGEVDIQEDGEFCPEYNED